MAYVGNEQASVVIATPPDGDKGDVVVSGNGSVWKVESVAQNLAFLGSAARITGDFTNATLANRVMFQTSTVNGATVVRAIPNGTGVIANFGSYNNSDPTNASQAVMGANSTEITFQSSITGTGTYLPMTFYTGGSERMRIDTSGNLGVGISPSAWGSGFRALELGYSGTSLSVNTSNGNAAIRGNLYANASAQSVYVNTGFASVIQALPSSGSIQLTNYPSASAGSVASAASATFQVTQTNCEMITANGGLGYGTGAGGTVTQATSKSTPVTLNRPTGRITTTADALAAGTAVAFLFNNSLIAAGDTVLVTTTEPNHVANAYGLIAGACAVRLTNISGVSQSTAVGINFTIIKGATS